MAIWYKEGVYGELSPAMEHAKRKIAGYFARIREELYITSKRDGTHGPESFHPGGNALDIRYPPGLPRNRVAIALRSIIGPDYDVVAEETHIHVEYDPE